MGRRFLRLHGPRTGRLAAALLATALGGCASAPPPPPQSADAVDVSGFAFRDPRQGAPGAGLSKKEGRRLDEAMVALRAGRTAEMERLLNGSAGPREGRPPLQLARVYAAIASNRWEEAQTDLEALAKTAPGWVSAIEARADLAAARGDLRPAYDGYRALLKLRPDDPRGKKRAEEVREALVERRRGEAETALAGRDFDATRRAALSLVELDPASPAGFQFLSRAAEASGKFEDAYVWAVKARALDPADTEWTETVADLAMKTGRYGDATLLYDELAAGEPEFREKADAARLEFQIHNLPDAAQRAARSPRVTRGQLANLAWWTVPEIRDAAGGPAEVAVDVVDRPDRSILVRSIALGLFPVSRETHRMGVEVPVSRAELGTVLRRVAAIVARGRPVKGCLAEDSPPAALVECGILSDIASRTVSGKETLRALERAARAGREGGTR